MTEKIKRWMGHLAIGVFLLLVAKPFARADAALLLQQPFGTFGAMNPTGHAAIYLSRICAATPVQLRRCHAGELGVVISRYHRIAGRDWIAIPVVPYLYAVEHIRDVTESVSAEDVLLARDSYRRKHLQDIAPDAADGNIPSGEWTQLVGASYERTIYGFAIETSTAQDDSLIAYLNARPNRARFNLFWRNCADFSTSIINFYYPKALHRSFIADAGITTPKQIAKSMVKFSERNSDLQSSSFVIPQVPGTLKRSTPARGVLESLVRSKKYVVPLALLYPWVATGSGVAYLTKGRFDPSKTASMVYEPVDLPSCIVAAERTAQCERILQAKADEAQRGQ
jgi:hypothetical protein